MKLYKATLKLMHPNPSLKYTTDKYILAKNISEVGETLQNYIDCHTNSYEVIKIEFITNDLKDWGVINLEFITNDPLIKK